MFVNQEMEYAVKEMNGDLFTPISLYQSLTGNKKFLLESSLKHEQTGRYSFVGSDPFLECKAYGNKVKLQHPHSHENEELEGDPVEIIQSLIPKDTNIDIDLPFTGGGLDI